MIAGLSAPRTALVRRAEALARAQSSDMLFNHVMRSYWFAELFAQAEDSRADRELMFLAAILHDLGLTDHARGPHRFEVEGANAAQAFLLQQGMAVERAGRVWDTIALHTLDLNLLRQDEARLVQSGILCDVVGAGLDGLPPKAVAEVLQRYPRLGFKQGFFGLLRAEVRRKPVAHLFHPLTMVEHHCCAPVTPPDAKALIEGAGFAE